MIACQSEHEALVLENTLIKQYRPRFNVRLKDDKSYLYLKIPAPRRARRGGAGNGARGGAQAARQERRGRDRCSRGRTTHAR